MEQYYEAVMNANARLNGLLWCFACLAAPPGVEPVETLQVAEQVRGFLEQELKDEEALFEAGQEAGAAAHAKVGLSLRDQEALYPSIAPCMCLRDAMKNLLVMISESQPLTEEHTKVYTTAAPVLTPQQCRKVIAAAETHAKNKGWSTKRHVAYPTHDLPATSEVLGAPGKVLKSRVESSLLPELAERFGLDLSALSIQEMFVAKYEPPSDVAGGGGALAALEEHEDGSEWSFVLALNSQGEDFRGGGTRFVRLEQQPTYSP